MNKNKIINLTPHTIIVKVEDKEFSFPASGVVARVSTCQSPAGEINNIPVVEQSFGAVDLGGISLRDDEIYIVSALVLNALKQEGHSKKLKQFVSPNTGKAIRDEEGHIIGVPGFVR